MELGNSRQIMKKHALFDSYWGWGWPELKWLEPYFLDRPDQRFRDENAAVLPEMAALIGEITRKIVDLHFSPQK